MSNLNTALTQKKPTGLYHFNSTAAPSTIKKFTEENGWRYFYLDGRKIATKQEFLTACARSFSFPTYFGNNWDAFEECLHDLPHAEGYIILFDNASKFLETPEWKTASSIFKEVIKDKKVYLLIRGNKIELDTL